MIGGGTVEILYNQTPEIYWWICTCCHWNISKAKMIQEWDANE